MNHTQQRRRQACTMPAYALYLTMKQQQHDRRDAKLMSRLVKERTEGKK